MLWSRPDGTPADVPPYRRAMPFLMPTRTESAVAFELEVDLARAEPFLAAFNAERGAEGAGSKASLFHLVLWAATRTLHERPRLNRFVAGGRIWDRDGIWISFSAKKRLDDGAPIVVIKRRFDPARSFAQLVDDLQGAVAEGRSDAPSTADKELDVLLRLPGCGFRAALALARWLDRWGLLPRAFIESDPFYASLFVANLGSLRMDAAYHHLYEYGTIPIFCVIGQVKEVPAVVDGELTVARRATLRFTFDERVEDGLYAQRALQRMRELIEDPAAAAVAN